MQSVKENIESMEQQGYTIIDDFIDDATATLLSDFFYQHNAQTTSTFYATSHHDDFSFRLKMSDYILSHINPKFEQLFQDLELLGSSYLLKKPGANGSLAPHQDWNIVDERFYNSYNIWIPLVDVNEGNGTIEVIPNSHLWHSTFRGASFASPYQKVEQSLAAYLKPLNIKKGAALIYDHRLLHASSDNTSTDDRLVVVAGIKPKAAPAYYFRRKRNIMELYHLTDNFYLKNPIDSGHKVLELAKRFRYKFPQFDIPK